MKQAIVGAFRCLVVVLVFAQTGIAVQTAGEPSAQSAAALPRPVLQHREWQIDGVTREALIAIPAIAKTTPTPVVFAFHGHGGTARFEALQNDFQDVWPGTIAVYMQGLPTASIYDPRGAAAGWQVRAGDQKDRDLKFFDAVLATLHKECRVDDKRVFAAGHSNGGWFTYLLWAARGDTLAAVAPSSAVAGQNLAALKPKPAMHLAGTSDPLVPFRLQMRTMTAVRALNGCEATGKPWATDCTLYPSKTGTPFVAFIHPGGHTYPREAPALIVKFFQENPKK